MDANHALHAALAPPARDFRSVLALEGVFDHHAAPVVSAALASEEGNVVVDLSDCTVLDPSVIRALLQHSRTLQEGRPAPRDRRPTRESCDHPRLLEILGIASIIPLRRRRVDAKTVHVLSGAGAHP